MKVESGGQDMISGYLEGQYSLHETVGRGGFAKVKKATHLVTGERVAIKIMDKVALGADLPRVAREIETLKTLSNPFICNLYHVFETPEKIFMVMEYCRGGELFDYIVQRDRLDEPEAKRIFRQIAVAVAYCHEKGVVHRDLKPENILLDDSNNVKLIDFGLCAAPEGGLSLFLDTCCGSPAYAAPELIKGQRYIGTAADVWSLGVLLYALLCGRLPFDDPNLNLLYRKIQDGRYHEPRYLSEGSKNILRCMLQVDPNYRLTVKELLSHTWCQDCKPVYPTGAKITDRNVLDEDVILLMSSYFQTRPSMLMSKILQWNYESQEVATYLILLDRKMRYGDYAFSSCGINIGSTLKASAYKNYYAHATNIAKVQKSLDAEFMECDTVDTALSNLPRSHHASMEGGLDDDDLLQIGSPKVDMENKENEGVRVTTEDRFSKPKIPSPKRQSRYNFDQASLTAAGISPARSADSILSDSAKTPRLENKWRGIGNSPAPGMTPSRRKVLGSLERGMDKIRLMLTPKTSSKHKPKLKTVPYSGKGAYNISSAAPQTDPDLVVMMLKKSLASAGIESKQIGYRLLGKLESSGHRLKFELEVVALEKTHELGIRRKRQQGDAWAYKRVIEQILNLSKDDAKPKVVSTPVTPGPPKVIQTLV